MARKRKEDTAPPDRFPHLHRWCLAHGWIEVGGQWQDPFFARALNEGGQVWGGEGPYRTMDEALQALEQGIAAFMAENRLE